MGKHNSPRSDPRDLERFGPRLEVQVGPPIIRNNPSLPWPGPGNFSKMPALIDTGAGRTVLTPQAVKRVGLPVVDYTMLARAGGTDKVPAHVASLHFPSIKMATIEVIQVLCCDLPDQPVHCLIGRDILSHWLFTYNGRTGEWSIEEEDLAVWVEPPEGALT